MELDFIAQFRYYIKIARSSNGRIVDSESIHLGSNPSLAAKNMKKNLVITLALLIIFGGGIGLGVFIRNQTLNPKATIPNVFERILAFFVRQGEKEDGDLLYYDTGLIDFIANGSAKTKVAVEGVVDKIAQQPDGDYHIIIRPPYLPLPVLVTEAIPEIKLPLPKEGDYIKIWGIVRFDILHNWWELHPVIGWKKL